MKEKPRTIYHQNGHFTPDPTGIRTKAAIAQPFQPDDLQPVSADDAYPLILKDERMGTLLCVDAGDIDNDGLQEIVVGSSTGAVALFDSNGELLWRYTHPIPATPITVKHPDNGQEFPMDDTEIMPLFRRAAIKAIKICSLAGVSCILGVSNQGAFALDPKGRIQWRYDEAQTSPYVKNPIRFIREETEAERILVLLEKPILLDSDGRVRGHLDAPRPVAAVYEDIDGDGVREFVILSHSHLYAFTRTGEQLWSLAAEDYGCTYFHASLSVEDSNTEGVKQILVASNKALIAFSHTGTCLWEHNDNSWNFEVVTVNEAKKIVTAGLRVLDLDGNLESTLSCPNDATAVIQFADMDNDSELELISGGRHKQILSVMKLSGELLWCYYVGGDVRGLEITDINNDGFLEIIIASEDVHVLSHTGQLLWWYRSGGVVKVQTADVDGDGKHEIVAASSALCVYNGAGQANWGCHIAHGWRFDIEKNRLAVGCRDELMYLFDGSGEVVWTQELHDRATASIIFDDINGDGEAEILAISEKISFYSQSGELIWQQPYSTAGRTIAKMSGQREKILVLGKCHHVDWDRGMKDIDWVFALDARGEMIWTYRYRPKDRTEIWEDKRAPMSFRAFVAVDLNDDGSDEIICVSVNRWLCSSARQWREKSNRVNTLHCLTVEGQLLWKAKLQAYFPCYVMWNNKLLLATDLNGDGEIQIVCGVHGLAVLSQEGEELWGRACRGPIWNVAAGDVNGDGKKEIVVVSDAVEVFSPTGEQLMEYVGLEGPKTLALADLDSDGVDEIIVGAEGIFVLKL